MMKMKRKSPLANQAAVNNWNRKHAIGVSVSVKLDDGSTLSTKTESAAWMMGGHSPMVIVKGISGGYSLDRVTAI